ncbi:Fic family protein [Aliarcobacter butzleri 7h1h]|uniref:Phage killer protein n=3 Tax=root TaxID=1 RepID=A0A0G9KRG3_9BACT|nr:RhuM family protein [Aliarcobacter butzleri]AGR77210.1 Fic family protein [Aliarcobacter butzleri 7h1h]KLE09134.1 phage killer protein [Aliarcobacter butzleri L355]MCG3696386.1 type II toxin-antitoxin system death-on-curing family toxin [Aliarcobacter butzleri]MCG3698663.1 type II toxin-antitoxin system death-on-curing family toxin [Aliarcobacter butzleri]MCT7591152.1 type II toxin-antitoxin system death-on-curing family toxin [Aliarcobacter butzleri]
MSNELNNQIVIYEDINGDIKLDVSLENDTLWLSQKQLEVLFDRDKSVISRHIKNIFKENELDKNAVVAKNATTATDGKVYQVEYYNLDMIISLGYRVNSKRATSFRVWATKILKDYLINGYSINNKRLQQKGLKELNETISLLKDTISKTQLELSEAKGLLDVIINYSRTWTLLQGYDEDSLKIDFISQKAKFILDIDEAKIGIEKLKNQLIKKGEATELFGREKAGEFEGILRNIYQTFGGVDLLESVEEKAANLLYYIIKGHPFNDGNKRIGAFIFILFLTKNNRLYKSNGELKINDNALVALSLMTAKSDPKQKETIINLIVNILQG